MNEPADAAAFWRDEAHRLDSECRELRVMLTNLLLAIAVRDELHAFGRDLIEQRFADDTSSVTDISSARRSSIDTPSVTPETAA